MIYSESIEHEYLRSLKSQSYTSKCQVSPERRVLDLESEIQGFNTHWGKILLREFFVFAQ